MGTSFWAMGMGAFARLGTLASLPLGPAANIMGEDTQPDTRRHGIIATVSTAPEPG